MFHQATALVGLAVFIAAAQAANETRCAIFDDRQGHVSEVSFYYEGRIGYDDCRRYDQGDLAIKLWRSCFVNGTKLYDGMEGFDTCSGRNVVRFVFGIILLILLVAFIIWAIRRALIEKATPPSVRYEYPSGRPITSTIPSTIQSA